MSPSLLQRYSNVIIGGNTNPYSVNNQHLQGAIVSGGQPPILYTNQPLDKGGQVETGSQGQKNQNKYSRTAALNQRKKVFHQNGSISPSSPPHKNGSNNNAQNIH